jgi:hypothetical protein
VQRNKGEIRTTKEKIGSKKHLFVVALLLLSSHIRGHHGRKKVEKFGLSDSNTFSKSKFEVILKNKRFSNLCKDLFTSEILLEHYKNKKRYKFKKSNEELVRENYPYINQTNFRSNGFHSPDGMDPRLGEQKQA